MSLSPAAAGPPPQKDQRGTDPPEFKHQVGRVAAAEVPLAEATPVVASPPITNSHIEARLLRLEAQLEPDRQQVSANPQQQQGGRPPAPSKTTGSSAKCSFSSKQKLWIALGIVLVVVVVLVVAVVITTVAGGPDSPVPVVPSSVAPAATAPVPPPTPPPARVNSIVPYINSITLSNQTLSYPPSTTGTAEELAVQWLIEDDLTTATDDLKALRQRYVLSTLWFLQTPTTFGTDDKNYTDTWTTDLDECAWLDVACDENDDQVTALSLFKKNVQGRIPDDLGLLTAMISMDLRDNTLSGTIPWSLGSLTALSYLGLGNNTLTGTIPSSLAAMTSLTSLWLGDNTLTGTIPSSLAAMTDLLELWPSINRLTGTIPSSLGLLTKLQFLILDNNRLTGTIPSSLGVLTNLTRLFLHNNQLNGTLPLCDLNRTFEVLVADCAEVSCPCCTFCCPTASEDGTIPAWVSC
jgi:hypothetical protein